MATHGTVPSAALGSGEVLDRWTREVIDGVTVYTCVFEGEHSEADTDRTSAFINPRLLRGKSA